MHVKCVLGPRPWGGGGRENGESVGGKGCVPRGLVVTSENESDIPIGVGSYGAVRHQANGVWVRGRDMVSLVRVDRML